MVLQLGEEKYRIAESSGSAVGGGPVCYGELATMDADTDHYLALVEEPDEAERCMVHCVRGSGATLTLAAVPTVHEDVDFDEDEDEDEEDEEEDEEEEEDGTEEPEEEDD